MNSTDKLKGGLNQFPIVITEYPGKLMGLFLLLVAPWLNLVSVVELVQEGEEVALASLNGQWKTTMTGQEER